MSLTIPEPMAETTGGESLTGLCDRSRPALAALGELGAPLLGVLGAVERVGRDRGVGLLDDPGFALEVLTEAGPGIDPAVVGRLLDFLRSQASAGSFAVAGRAGDSRRAGVTVADAVASYEAGALALIARGSQGGYRTWARRLVAVYGAQAPEEVTAGDLKDLIARWVVKVRESNPRARRGGSSVETTAVTAFRHLWGYFVDKGWVPVNVAKSLRKPPPDEPLRRPFRPEEAAVIRHLARGLGRRDGLLNEVTISISERLGLRRIELTRLRMCDVDLDRAEMRVWGKGNKFRTMPIPPILKELLARYRESRRPADIPPEAWEHSEEQFLRHRPDDVYLRGRPVAAARLDRLFRALRDAAPEIFVNGDLSQHCYRHAPGTFVDGRYGRAVTRAVLGHKGHRSPTDHYVHVTPETIREVIDVYEQHLLAADPTTGDSGGNGRSEVAEGAGHTAGEVAQ